MEQGQELEQGQGQRQGQDRLSLLGEARGLSGSEERLRDSLWFKCLHPWNSMWGAGGQQVLDTEIFLH